MVNITVISANVASDDDLIGKMDPYVRFRLGGATQETSVKKGAGKDPVWNEQVQLQGGNDATLSVELMDSDFGPDEHVGKTEINLQGLSGNNQQAFPLFKGGRQIGEIQLRIQA